MEDGAIPAEALMMADDSDPENLTVDLDASPTRFDKPGTRTRTGAIKHAAPTSPYGHLAVKRARLADDVDSSAGSDLNDSALAVSVNGEHDLSQIMGLSPDELQRSRSTGEIDPEVVRANKDPNLNYYSCNQCNKFFWTENSMRHHFSMYHSEKAFVCEICGKAFRFRSNLAEHRSVHTSLKPYVCKYCGKSSRLKGNLTKHILKHHKVETNAVVGKEDIIIKKGKKSVKDPKCIDFLQKSMIVLTEHKSSADHSPAGSGSPVGSASSTLAAMASQVQQDPPLVVSSPIPVRKYATSAQHPASQNSLHVVQPDGSIQSSVNSIIETALGANLTNAKMAEDCRLPVVKSDEVEVSGASTPSGFEDTHSSGGLEDCFGGDGLQSMSKNNTQCPFCNKHFRKASQLEHHLRSYHGAIGLGQIVAVPERQKPVEELSSALGNASPAPQPRSDGKITPQTTQALLNVIRASANAQKSNSLQNGHTNYASEKMETALRQNGGTPTHHGHGVSLGHHGSRSGTPLTNGGGPPLPIVSADRPASHKNGSTPSVPPGAADPFFCFSQRLNNLAGCQRDIQEIKDLLGALKSSYATAHGTKNGFSAAQPKIESLLTSLDNRVSRVERQMEASLSTLGTLIQVQTSMNLAMSQFRMEIMAKVASLADQLKPIACVTTTSAPHCASPVMNDA